MFYVVEYEIFASGDSKKPKFTSTAANHVLRTLMILMSAMVCFIQYFHYSTLLQIQKILKLKDKRETIKTSGYLKYLIFECIVNMTICPPFVDGAISIPQLKGQLYLTYNSMGMFMALLRFYNVLKVPEQYSIWTTENSIKVCKQNRFTPDISFLVKAELKR